MREAVERFSALHPSIETKTRFYYNMHILRTSAVLTWLALSTAECHASYLTADNWLQMPPQGVVVHSAGAPTGEIAPGPWDSGVFTQSSSNPTQTFMSTAHNWVTGDGGIHHYLRSVAGSGDPNYSVVYAGAETRILVNLAFRSNTLPVGTPVQLLVTMAVHDTLSPCVRQGLGWPNGTGGASIRFGLDNDSVTDESCHPADPAQKVISKLYNSAIGAEGSGTQLQFIYYLYSRTGAAAGGLTGAYNFAEVDAGNTAAISVQLLTAGATYSTDAGFLFPETLESVPEPETSGIILLGLIALPLLRRCYLGPGRYLA